MRKKVFAAGLTAAIILPSMMAIVGCGGGGGGNAVEPTGEIVVRLVMTDAGKAVAPPDPRLTNWVVVLEASDEGQIRELATDDTGVVKFGQLFLGRSYVVTIREREGWTIVQSSEVFALDAARKTRDISVSVSRGAPEPEPTGEILVRLSATDADQEVVAPDPRLKDWVVRIVKLDAGKGLTEQATDDTGSARFAELDLGGYTVNVQAKAGWTVAPLIDNGAVVLDDEHKSRTVSVEVNRPAPPEPEPIVDPTKSTVQCFGDPPSDGPKGTADGVDRVGIYAEAFGPDGEILQHADLKVDSWFCTSNRPEDMIDGGPLIALEPGGGDAVGTWTVKTTKVGVATYTVRVTDKNGNTVTLGTAQATWEVPPEPEPEPEPLVDASKSVVQVLGRAANDFEPRGKADGIDFVWLYVEVCGADGKLLHRSDISEWIVEGRPGDADDFEGGPADYLGTPDNPDPSIGEWKVRTIAPGTATYVVKVKDALTGKTITLGSGVATWEDP